jgi:hypothetical protein
VRYNWHTQAGTVWIHPRLNGWFISLEGDVLDGPFGRAQAALEMLLGGQSYWPSFADPELDDPSRLGIPEDISQWEAVH